MKHKFDQGLIGNQQGQGIIEYILILVVTVALILGLVVQFNTAFQVWANNYFGEYLSCLLETGELPSIEGQPGNISSTCDEAFEPFSLAKGRPAKGFQNVGSNRGGSTPSTSAASSEKESSSASNGSVARSSRGRSGGKFGSSTAGGGAGGRKGVFAPGEESSYTGSTEMGSYTMVRKNESVGFTSAERIRTGYVLDREKKEKKTSGPIKVGKNTGVEKQERMKINPKAAVKRDVASDTPWSFGDYLRYLIIAAIIIALVIFFGGQALQISKSMD